METAGVEEAVWAETAGVGEAAWAETAGVEEAAWAETAGVGETTERGAVKTGEMARGRECGAGEGDGRNRGVFARGGAASGFAVA
jgi:hypothetical protein